MAYAWADGSVLPPLVIFPTKHLYATWHGSNVFIGTSYAKLDNDWMTAEIFTVWFSNCIKRITHPPIIVIFAGHKAHLSLKLIEMARAENISLIKLTSHTTDCLQPLDVSCFRPLKIAWDKKLTEYQREHGFRNVPNSDFVDLLCEVWPKAFKPNVIQNGFRATGLMMIRPL
jgi:hypothetical protein